MTQWELSQAEQEVRRNSDRFETAVTNLGDVVEAKVLKLKRVAHAVGWPKRAMVNGVALVRTGIRANPKPFAVVAVLGIFMIAAYMWRKHGK